MTLWRVRSAGSPLPVLPDGCRDLVLHLQPSGPPAVFLTALEATPRQVHLPEGTELVGIRLPAGARLAWEEHSPPCGSGDLDLRRAGGPAVPWLRALARRPDRARELLHAAAARWIRPPEPVVGDFLQALAGAPGRLPRIGTSERTLRRRIRASTGASPSFWVQLHRARRAAARLVSTRDSLPDVAFDCGYADQAHLTRDMRRWFGTTPGLLRAGAEPSRGALLLAPDAFAPRELPDGSHFVSGP